MRDTSPQPQIMNNARALLAEEPIKPADLTGKL
jgi:hypothetical protein